MRRYMTLAVFLLTLVSVTASAQTVDPNLNAIYMQVEHPGSAHAAEAAGDQASQDAAKQAQPTGQPQEAAVAQEAAIDSCGDTLTLNRTVLAQIRTQGITRDQMRQKMLSNAAPYLRDDPYTPLIGVGQQAGKALSLRMWFDVVDTIYGRNITTVEGMNSVVRSACMKLLAQARAIGIQ
jgi:hypothetical protein